MSFSIELKKELCRLDIESTFSALAELSAFVRTNGTISMSNFEVNVRFETTNNSIIRRIFKLLKYVYNYDGKIIISRRKFLKSRIFYKLIIEDKELSKKFLTDVHFTNLDSWFIEDNLKEIKTNKDYIKHFLRGAFLGSGSISNPDKNYHLEIVLNSLELAKMFVKYLKLYKIHAKIYEKKEQAIIYLKDAEQISDFMTLVGALNIFFEYENIRMIKEMKNKANRVTNCEMANLNKTLSKSFLQIDAINTIYKKIGKDKLDEGIRELCELRIKYPEHSLQKLADLLNISKSGVNHRFKKIMELAEKASS